jgi:hypothetical protein
MSASPPVAKNTTTNVHISFAPLRAKQCEIILNSLVAAVALACTENLNAGVVVVKSAQNGA